MADTMIAERTAKTQAPRDIPIIFSAPMVQALLGGRKTQTRRIITKKAALNALSVFGPSFLLLPGNVDLIRYAVGDVLWVRENFATSDAYGYPGILGVEYAADGSTLAYANGELHHKEHGCARYTGPWRPSIHMPRWASRLTLIVEGVNVERLQDISEEDAKAEGMQEPSLRDLGGDLAQAAWSERQVFSRLWTHLHGPDAWAANPWVVAISFRVIRSNIDALCAASRGEG